MMKRALLAVAAIALVGFTVNTASADYCPSRGGYGYGYRPYAARSVYYGPRAYPGGYGYRGYSRVPYGYGYGAARYGVPGGFYGRPGVGYYGGSGVSLRIRF